MRPIFGELSVRYKIMTGSMFMAATGAAASTAQQIIVSRSSGLPPRQEDLIVDGSPGLAARPLGAVEKLFWLLD